MPQNRTTAPAVPVSSPIPPAAQQVIGLYRRHASAWAAARAHRAPGPPMEAPWLDRFLALLPEQATVLDLGCGSGRPIAAYLIERGCRVTGIDAAREMIALCRQSFPSQDWRTADMRTLALCARFDGILAWDSFFHLCHDDQRRMFPIFRAHAVPRAALMFTSGPAHGEAIGTLQGETLYHASLDPGEYRALLDANSFDAVSHTVEDPDCGRHTIWLAQGR